MYVGLKPRYNIRHVGHDLFEIDVTAPEVFGGATTIVQLTLDQAARFADWDCKKIPLIQEALPDVSADEREILLTGMTPEVWNQFTSDDDDKD
jgi:hypothetical protein